MTTSTASSTRPRACAWAPAEPRRHAAPGADVFREPRRQRAGPQLPGRPAGFRGRHERQGAGAGHDQHALHRAHRPVQRQRILAARPGPSAARRIAATADPPLLHRHRVRRRDQQPHADLPQHQPAGAQARLGYQGLQDRFHQRGRRVPGHAGPHQRPRPGHRAAGLTGQARALATRYASAASCRAKSRWRRPSPAAEAGAIARHRKGPIR